MTNTNIKEYSGTLVSDLYDLLFEGIYDFYDKNLEIHKLDNGFEIEYGCEYTSPKLDFDKLVKLSTLFGTTEIDVDDYNYSGCESCDYGSEYGHKIQVLNPTENLQILDYQGKVFC